MSKLKSYLTTGQAAAIFSIDPDTVLRWIKRGYIPTIRTPGGHYRILRNTFLKKMIGDNFLSEEETLQKSIPYCWEFNSGSGKLHDECKQCIVFQARAQRCYELCQIPAEIGHSKLVCLESCQDCQYFTTVVQSTRS